MSDSNLFPVELVRDELRRRGVDWDTGRVIKSLASNGFYISFIEGMALVLVVDVVPEDAVLHAADECAQLGSKGYGIQDWLELVDSADTEAPALH